MLTTRDLLKALSTSRATGIATNEEGEGVKELELELEPVPAVHGHAPDLGPGRSDGVRDDPRRGRGADDTGDLGPNLPFGAAHCIVFAWVAVLCLVWSLFQILGMEFELKVV